MSDLDVVVLQIWIVLTLIGLQFSLVHLSRENTIYFKQLLVQKGFNFGNKRQISFDCDESSMALPGVCSLGLVTGKYSS